MEKKPVKVGSYWTMQSLSVKILNFDLQLSRFLQI